MADTPSLTPTNSATPSVMTTSSDTTSVMTTSSDTTSVMTTSSDTTSVMTTISDTTSVMTTSSATPFVMTTSSDTPSVMPTSSDTPSVMPTSSDTSSSSDDELLTPTSCAKSSVTTAGSATPCKTGLEEIDLDCVGGNVRYYNKSQAILGQEAHAIVYKGKFGQNKGIEIAVKRIKFSTVLAAQEAQAEVKRTYSQIDKKKKKREYVLLEQMQKHPNIVDYKDSYTHDTVLYIAFEMAMGTLADYVDASNESWRQDLKPIDVNRGVASGLAYVHSKRIVHRDLKPSNILIINGYQGIKAVISDFGSAKETLLSMYSQSGRTGTSGFIAPEIWEAFCKSPNERNKKEYTPKSDIFSEGIVFYYTLSLGSNPFGFEHTAQFEIQNGSPPTFDKIAQIRNTFASQSLLQRMLDADPVQRPTADDVSKHPAMWTDEEILSYLGTTSDDIFDEKIGSSTLGRLEDSTIIPYGNWMNNLQSNTQTYLKNRRINRNPSSKLLYSGKETSVSGLLRAIRNTSSHYGNYHPKARAELGEYPGGYVDTWLNVCPMLLMHVYNILEPLKGDIVP